MNRRLKITIRPFEEQSGLLAYADVTVRVKFGEITIKRFKILSGEDKPWVAFPQIQYTQLLETKYVNLLHMNKRLEDYLSNQILKAYRQKVAERELSEHK